MDDLEESTAPIFVGDVRTTAIREIVDGVGVPGILVSFAPSAYTKVHQHSADQVLIVVSGHGYVGDPERPERVAAGDVIRIPAGVPHVHGAGPDSEFQHVALLAGTTTVSDDPVDWPPASEQAGA